MLKGVPDARLVESVPNPGKSGVYNNWVVEVNVLCPPLMSEKAGAVVPIHEFTLQLQAFWFLAAGNSPLSGVAERVGTLHTLAPKLC
jgi:hypothetical protein